MDFDPAVEGARLLAAGAPVVQGAMTRKHRWGPVAIDVLGNRGAALFEVRTRRRRFMVLSHQEREPSGAWVEVWRHRAGADPRVPRRRLGDDGRIFTSTQASSGDHSYVLAHAVEGIERVRVAGREVPVSTWGWVFVLRPAGRIRGPRPARFRSRRSWVELRRATWWQRRGQRRFWPEIDVEGVAADGTVHPGRLLG